MSALFKKNQSFTSVEDESILSTSFIIDSVETRYVSQGVQTYYYHLKNYLNPERLGIYEEDLINQLERREVSLIGFCKLKGEYVDAQRFVQESSYRNKQVNIYIGCKPRTITTKPLYPELKFMVDLICLQKDVGHISAIPYNKGYGLLCKKLFFYGLPNGDYYYPKNDSKMITNILETLTEISTNIVVAC